MKINKIDVKVYLMVILYQVFVMYACVIEVLNSKMSKFKAYKADCEHSHDLRGGDSPAYNDDSGKASKCK